MESQQFCLRWSNHNSNMLDIFGRLLNNEELCDVTLACDGLSLKAHKLVLSASSSFFLNLFMENPCTHPVIILPELKYRDMKALVDFMYHGQVNVSETQLSTLLKAAETLKIKGLGDVSNDRPQNFVEDGQRPNISETSVDTSALRMQTDLAVQTKKIFKDDPDSKSDDVEFHEELQLSSSNSVSASKVSRLPSSNPHSADPQSNNLVAGLSRMENAKQNADISNLACTSDVDLDMVPSRMMEQTMTTENLYQEQPTVQSQIMNKHSFHNEVDNSINCDDSHTSLPENLHPNELLSPASHYNQDICCASKELDIETASSDHPEYMTATAAKDGLMICKEEQNVSEQVASSFVMETSSHSENAYSQGNMLSASDIEFLKNGPKRGRKPGSRLCVLCKRIFVSESDLEKHMLEHRSGSHSNVSESKMIPEGLDIHDSSDSQTINEKNLVKLPVSCSTCNCVLNTMSDAQSHLSMNPNCRTSQFKCLLCPKLFIWPATLVKHFREQHQGPGGTARVTQRLWFFCDICNKPLLSKHALCLHRSKFHGFIMQPHGSESSESLIACKRGRKQGTRVCRLCKRTFTSTNEYHVHIQNFHRNNLLYGTSVESESNIHESLSSTENESNSAQSVA